MLQTRSAGQVTAHAIRSRWAGAAVVVVVGAGIVVWGAAGETVAQTTAAEPGRASPARQLHEVWRAPIEEREDNRAPQGPPSTNVGEPGTRRPSSQSVWIGGYWDYDASSGRYVWVGGTWRVPPPGRTWVPGAWYRDEQAWYRVAGFWSPTPASPYRAQGPPSPPSQEARGPRPSARHLWVPGHYVPQGDTVAWKPGFWSELQPGWTWIPATWLSRPQGWVFQDGFWLSDADLRAACDQVAGDRSVTAVISPSPSQLGGPVTDTGQLLREWARAQAAATGPPVERSLSGRPIPGIPDYNALRPFVLQQPGSDTSYGPVMSSPGSGVGNGPPLNRGPSNAYYVGNDAPGSTYRSYSQTPAGSPSRSVYVGNSLPGTSYRSYSLTPSGLPGTSRYVGNSAPGSTYRSYSPSAVDSIGNYGYGTSAPGNTAGQIGGIRP